MSAAMSSRRGDRGADLVARHQRDVVDREDVRRVGHRDDERALAGEGDRHRLVALGGGAREQVGGGHVDRGRRVRSRWSRPWRSAIARASWSCGRSRPSRGGPARASSPPSRAASTAARRARASAKPELDDDVGEEARRRRGAARVRDAVPGAAARRQRAGRGRPSATGRRWGMLGRLDASRRAARRITSSGARARSRAEAQRALADQDLQTVDAPAAPASRPAAGARCRRPGRPGRPRTRIARGHRRQGQILERRGRVVQADRRAVDEQVGRRRRRRPRRRRGRRRAPRRALGVRFQTATSAPGVAQRLRAARALPPAPRTSARRAARARRARRAGRARRCCRRGSRPSGPNVSVFAAPIARASSVARRRRARAPPPCAGS